MPERSFDEIFQFIGVLRNITVIIGKKQLESIVQTPFPHYHVHFHNALIRFSVDLPITIEILPKRSADILDAHFQQ